MFADANYATTECLRIASSARFAPFTQVENALRVLDFPDSGGVEKRGAQRRCGFLIDNILRKKFSIYLGGRFLLRKTHFLDPTHPTIPSPRSHLTSLFANPPRHCDPTSSLRSHLVMRSFLVIANEVKQSISSRDWREKLKLRVRRTMDRHVASLLAMTGNERLSSR